MKILMVLMTSGLLVFLGQQAVTLHKLTVCRQEAWQASLVLQTHSLLTQSSHSEKEILFKCRMIVTREKNAVSWVRLPLSRRHQFPLRIEGKL